MKPNFPQGSQWVRIPGLKSLERREQQQQDKGTQWSLQKATSVSKPHTSPLTYKKPPLSNQQSQSIASQRPLVSEQPQLTSILPNQPSQSTTFSVSNRRVIINQPQAAKEKKGCCCLIL